MMTDHETPQPVQEPPKDALVEALRDIPRLRELKDDRWRARSRAPPPLVSRLGARLRAAAALLILASLPMLMTALWYGYYLWGRCCCSRALLLMVGSANVFRGRRTAVIAAVVVLAGVLMVAFQWTRFVPAAGALAPGPVRHALFPVTMLVGVALVMTFLLHAVALAYWKRLKPCTRPETGWAGPCDPGRAVARRPPGPAEPAPEMGG
jgi:hypothetical protein